MNDLSALAGEWTIEIHRPETSAEPVRGRMRGELVLGGVFLELRWTIDHPVFPDAVSLIGGADPASYRWHYFDTRGVDRTLRISVSREAWTAVREDPDFWQRFTSRVDGDVISGAWEMSHDEGATWQHDFDVTYARVG
ncbi:MAG TPA: hypothetical protein VGJ44_26130 [Kribbellaceae bacterium]